jgi:hypothetical protein
MKGSFLVALLCSAMALFVVGCCCRDNGSAMDFDPEGAAWGPASAGLACRLDLPQPLIAPGLAFYGELHIKNVSRRVIFIETPALRNPGETAVSLILAGRPFACKAVEDGFASYPEDLIALDPGDLIVLPFTWQMDPRPEEGPDAAWPGPGRSQVKARLICPEPRGGLFEEKPGTPDHVIFRGVLESGPVFVDIIAQENP